MRGARLRRADRRGDTLIPLWLGVALGATGAGPVPAGLDAVAAPRRVALVVGLDRYGDATAGVGDLRYAAADAAALGDLLEGQGYRVHRLLEEATIDGFRDAFAQATADLQRDDLFFLYFAGHAELEPARDGHALDLLFHGRDAGERLEVDALAGWVDDVGARRRVVVLDTCYSERTQELLARNRGGPPSVIAPAVGQFDAWIYAAAPRQAAQEDPALGHGVFTWYLLQGLKGEADANGDGVVGVLEAYSWVGYQTANHTGRAQVPWLEESRIGWEDLPLTTVDATTDAVAAVPWYERVLPGASVLLDGFARGPGPIEAGRHAVEVRDRDGAVLLKRTIAAPAGGVLDADPWLHAAAGTVQIGAGLGWTSPQDRVPAASGGLVAWVLPRSAGAVRPAFGAAGSVARGAPGGVDLTEAVATGRVAALWQLAPPVQIGPWVGAGANARYVDGRADGTPPQGGPVGEAGLHLGWTAGALWIGADAGARLWPVDGAVVAHPTAGVALGAALR